MKNAHQHFAKSAARLAGTSPQQSYKKNARRAATLLCLATGLLVSGCASIDIEKSIAHTNTQAASFTQGKLHLARTAAQSADMAAQASEILRKPLSQQDAVRLALFNSPALQAMLAQNWADMAGAAQTGRIANPIIEFERMRVSDELELGRLLSFGLLDLISLPQRQQIAQQKLVQQQLRLTSNVIDHITQVRQAWVKAVAAQQSLHYARQVNEAAQASSELARRMQTVGNFSKLQRARQQAFYAEASMQWAAAQHANTANREKLSRLLGLSVAQAELLQLPSRLPDLPKKPLSGEEVSQLATKGRLDIQLAQAEYNAQAKAQGLTSLTSFTDIELGQRRDTEFDNAEASSSTKRGFELSVRLPVFDWGDMQRSAMNAQTLAAAQRLEATVRAASSHLNESYSAYRTAFDVSKHYRDEVVPLRKLISEENVLRYNGMLIGVFELLADSKDQVHSVMAAIEAEQQFWLADAALQATMMGKPVMATVAAMAGGNASEAEH